MIFYKRVLILSQTNANFDAGKGIVKLEKLGDELSLELSLINYKVLKKGSYKCVIVDNSSNYELFDVDNFILKTKRKSNLDFSKGVLCFILYIDEEVEMISSIKQGNINFGEREALDKLKLSYPQIYPPKKVCEFEYADEKIATENYFELEKEKKFEKQPDKDNEDENISGEDYPEKTEKNFKTQTLQDEKIENLFLFEKESSIELPEYYKTIRGELKKIFSSSDCERALERQIENSKWAKVYFSNEKYYVVGIIYDEKSPKYICYGIPVNSKEEKIKEIDTYSTFIPLSPLKSEGQGYYILFQNAENGSCINIDYT